MSVDIALTASYNKLKEHTPKKIRFSSRNQQCRLTVSSISSLNHNHLQNQVSPLGGGSGASIVLVLAARDGVIQQRLPLGTPKLVRSTGSVRKRVCYGVLSLTVEQLCILQKVCSPSVNKCRDRVC